MTIQDWGALGELLGAIGVILTLLYLAAQIKQNSRQLRSNGYQSAAQTASFVTSTLLSDPSYLRLFYIAEKDYDELNEEEQVLARALFNDLFIQYEALYYQYEGGVVDPDIWGGRKRLLLFFLQRPGIASWWRDWGQFYGTKFQKYLAQESKLL